MTPFSQHEFTRARIRLVRKALERATRSARELRDQAEAATDRAGREQFAAHATFYELEAQRAERELADLERLRTWQDGQELASRWGPQSSALR